MSNELEELRARVAALERQLAAVKAVKSDDLESLSRFKEAWVLRRSVRRRSSIYVGDWPLYDIALGPDLSTGETLGRAWGIFAFGDIATGVIAIGKLARGIVAIGAVAVGLVSMGGLAIGAGVAIGGSAIGFVALGGAALGFAAIGGGALGYYSCGGGALGKHVVDAMNQDPEAIRFFSKWLPGFDRFF
jgi:hypothetical protein